MFAVDEATVVAIRRAFREQGELAAVVELRRRFPLIESNQHATSCVRAIASWTSFDETSGKREQALTTEPVAGTTSQSGSQI